MWVDKSFHFTSISHQSTFMAVSKKEFKANNGKKKGKRPLTAVDVVEETIADDWFVYSERWPPLPLMDFQMNGQGRNMPERG